MRSTIARANLLFLLVLGALLLALGWAAAHAERPFGPLAFGLHVSLGVIATAAFVAEIVLRVVTPPPPYPSEWPRARRRAAGLCEFLAYLAFAAVIASGALWAVTSGASLDVFGAPLPVSGFVDAPLADMASQRWGEAIRATIGETTASQAALCLHRIFAILFALAIVAHIAFGGLARFRPRPLAALTPAPPAPMEPSPTQGLASRLRLFGWLQFWPQLAIALASGVLLQFSTSGRAFSPSQSGYGDAIYWSLFAFLLLCMAAALAFFYTRAARSVARPDYLGGHKSMAFWFLSLGLLIGLIGMILSFVGLSLSVSLLVAKTVSQPPGIAITDPNKIIRALDVFVLLVNFALLLAHFIGTGVAAWLTAEASRARYRFVAASPPQENHA